ncbi:hypothetical protein ACFLRC_03005, partial [Candidatus Altiarchaeota archaeon]
MSTSAAKKPKPNVKAINGTSRTNIDLGHLEIPKELLPELKGKRPFEVLHGLEEKGVVDTKKLKKDLDSELERLREGSEDKDYSRQSELWNGLNVLGVYHKQKSTGLSLRSLFYRLFRKKNIREAEEEVSVSFTSEHQEEPHVSEIPFTLTDDRREFFRSYKRLSRLHGYEGEKSLKQQINGWLEDDLQNGRFKVTRVTPLSVKKGREIYPNLESEMIGYGHPLRDRYIPIDKKQTPEEKKLEEANQKAAVEGCYLVTAGKDFQFLIEPDGKLILLGLPGENLKSFHGMKIPETFYVEKEDEGRKEVDNPIHNGIWEAIDEIDKQKIPGFAPLMDQLKDANADRSRIQLNKELWNIASPKVRERLVSMGLGETKSWINTDNFQAYKNFLSQISRGTLPGNLDFLNRDESIKLMLENPSKFGPYLKAVLGDEIKPEVREFLCQPRVWDALKEAKDSHAGDNFTSMVETLNNEGLNPTVTGFLKERDNLGSLLNMGDYSRKHYFEALSDNEFMTTNTGEISEKGALLLRKETLAAMQADVDANYYDNSVLKDFIDGKASVDTFMLVTDPRLIGHLQTNFKGGWGSDRRGFVLPLRNEERPIETRKAFLDNIYLVEGWGKDELRNFGDLTDDGRYPDGIAHKVVHVLDILGDPEKRKIVEREEIKKFYGSMEFYQKVRFLYTMGNRDEKDIPALKLSIDSAFKDLKLIEELRGEETPSAVDNQSDESKKIPSLETLHFLTALDPSYNFGDTKTYQGFSDADVQKEGMALSKCLTQKERRQILERDDVKQLYRGMELHERLGFLKGIGDKTGTDLYEHKERIDQTLTLMKQPEFQELVAEISPLSLLKGATTFSNTYFLTLMDDKCDFAGLNKPESEEKEGARPIAFLRKLGPPKAQAYLKAVRSTSEKYGEDTSQKFLADTEVVSDFATQLSNEQFGIIFGDSLNILARRVYEPPSAIGQDLSPLTDPTERKQFLDSLKQLSNVGLRAYLKQNACASNEDIKIATSLDGYSKEAHYLSVVSQGQPPVKNFLRLPQVVEKLREMDDEKEGRNFIDVISRTEQKHEHSSVTDFLLSVLDDKNLPEKLDSDKMMGDLKQPGKSTKNFILERLAYSTDEKALERVQREFLADPVGNRSVIQILRTNAQSNHCLKAAEVLLKGLDQEHNLNSGSQIAILQELIQLSSHVAKNIVPGKEFPAQEERESVWIPMSTGISEKATALLSSEHMPVRYYALNTLLASGERPLETAKIVVDCFENLDEIEKYTGKGKALPHLALHATEEWASMSPDQCASCVVASIKGGYNTDTLNLVELAKSDGRISQSLIPTTLAEHAFGFDKPQRESLQRIFESPQMEKEEVSDSIHNGFMSFWKKANTGKKDPEVKAALQNLVEAASKTQTPVEFLIQSFDYINTIPEKLSDNLMTFLARQPRGAEQLLTAKDIVDELGKGDVNRERDLSVILFNNINNFTALGLEDEKTFKRVCRFICSTTNCQTNRSLYKEDGIVNADEGDGIQKTVKNILNQLSVAGRLSTNATSFSILEKLVSENDVAGAFVLSGLQSIMFMAESDKGLQEVADLLLATSKKLGINRSSVMNEGLQLCKRKKWVNSPGELSTVLGEIE